MNRFLVPPPRVKFKLNISVKLDAFHPEVGGVFF